VSQTWIDVKFPIAQPTHRTLEQIETCELIAISGQHQDGAGDLAPMAVAKVLRMARSVQRVAEQDQPHRTRFRRDHAGDPAAVGMSADHRRRQVSTYLIAQ
jgi:hypothetical protein